VALHLSQLWLPIVLGTFFAWIASAVIHVIVRYHNSDYQRLTNEDEIMDAIRNASPPLGIHSFPYCVDMKEMKDEAVQQRFIKGPVGLVTVLPNGLPNMGKLMVQQISFFLFGCILIAYCATLALEPAAQFLAVFRFVSTVGFLTFGWAIIPYSIWFGHLWSMTAKYLLDALIYGLVVAGTFAWLWPAATG
jgi:hypothetical protein